MGKNFFTGTQRTEEEKKAAQAKLDQKREREAQELAEQGKLLRERELNKAENPYRMVKTLIGQRLIVKEVKEELNMTKSGIILAQLENANVPKKGEVVKVGLEVADYIERYKGKPIKEGSIVLYDNTQYQQLLDNTTALDIIDLSNFIAVCGQ